MSARKPRGWICPWNDWILLTPSHTTGCRILVQILRLRKCWYDLEVKFSESLRAGLLTGRIYFSQRKTNAATGFGFTVVIHRPLAAHVVEGPVLRCCHIHTYLSASRSRNGNASPLWWFNMIPLFEILGHAAKKRGHRWLLIFHVCFCNVLLTTDVTLLRSRRQLLFDHERFFRAASKQPIFFCFVWTTTEYRMLSLFTEKGIPIGVK